MSNFETIEEANKKIIELENEISSLKSRKKYGLVWEEQPEEIEEICKTKIPVLKSLSSMDVINDGLNHLLIEGDNLHTLMALQKTHMRKIDVIYIDPPYNTGNKDFVYNDRFVDNEDNWRHSKWLSFMAKRLRLAKLLLNERGVIFISIDDNEQAQLKLLMDEIFGEGNFVANVIRNNGSVRAMANKIDTRHEYCFVYCRDICQVKFSGIERDDADNFSNIDNDPNGLWSTQDLTVRTNGHEYSLPLMSGKLVSRKWRFTQDKMKLVMGGQITQTFQEIYEKAIKINNVYVLGKVVFKNIDGIPSLKKYFNDVKYITQGTLVSHSQRSAGSELKMIGINFDYPKPVSLIKHLISLHPNPNAIVLDFFSGSGTTGQAVLELNREDGGNRQFILATNNENNICREVCYERIRRLLTGECADGRSAEEGSLRFYTNDFVVKHNNRNQLRMNYKKAVVDLMCVSNNTFEKVENNNDFAIYKNIGKVVVLIKNFFNLENVFNITKEVKLPVGIYYFDDCEVDFSQYLNGQEVLFIKPIPERL